MPIKDDQAELFFIVRLPSGDSVPDTREPGGDCHFLPLNHPEVWLRQGDPTIYFTDPTP